VVSGQFAEGDELRDTITAEIEKEGYEEEIPVEVVFSECLSSNTDT